MPARYRDEIDYDEMGKCDVTTKASGLIATSQFKQSRKSRSMFDIVVPGYHKRIAAGEIINNPCTYRVLRLNEADGTVRGSTSGGGWYQWDGLCTSKALDIASGDPWNGLNPLETKDLIPELKLQALANIDRTPYEFGEDLLEVRETLRFIRRPFGELDKLLSRLRQSLGRGGNRVDWEDVARKLAHSWNEYSFAYVPLVHSAHKALEATTRNIASKQPPRRSARSRQTQSDITDQTKTVPGNSSGDELTFFVYHSIDEDCRAQILYTNRSPLKSWGHIAGLRWKDLPTVAWQILPYSFMVDRVVDISSVISAVTNYLDPTIEILAASTTSRLQETATEQLVDRSTPGQSVSVSAGVRINDSFLYHRQPWTPSHTDIIPEVGDLRGLVSDFRKTAQLVSLVTAKLLGDKPRSEHLF